MKHISKKDLNKVLEKHSELIRIEHTLNQFTQSDNAPKKTRIVVRKGNENIILLLSDIVLFHTENKVVYAIDRNGQKMMATKSLANLIEELDNKMFFRANRKYILNINYIKSFKPYKRVKLWVELTIISIEPAIVISQETAPLFRKWLSDA